LILCLRLLPPRRGRHHHDDRLRGSHGERAGSLRSPLDDDDHAFASKYQSLEEVAGKVRPRRALRWVPAAATAAPA
jgi:hypothetical protein